MLKKYRSSSLRYPPRRLSSTTALSLLTSLAGMSLLGVSALGQQEPPVLTALEQMPSGVIPLPQGPPPTGLKAPLPRPALPLPKPGSPDLASPGLKQLNERLKNRPISIDEAVAIALATNRSLALAGEALLRAQGRTAETRTAFNPTLGASASYTILDQGSSFAFGGQQVTIVPTSQRQIGVQATLPIDISGLLQTSTQQAQFQEVSARLDINRTRNQIVLDVKSACYDVLRAKELVAVASRSLQNSLERLSDAEKKFRAGTVARFDVIRAQTDVANAQQTLIQARSNVSLAYASLNNAIGIDIDTPLQLKDEERAMVEKATPAPQNPPPDDTFDSLDLGKEYEAVRQEALGTRPEVWQAEANIAAAKKGIQLARRSQLPSFGLSAGVTYAPDVAGFTPRHTTGQFVASLTIPLFEGGAARAREIQAKADVASAETQRRQTIDLIVLEVRQAYLTLVQARNRVAVADQALVQAQESFRLARVRYNAGVSTLVEVSDAQTALTQAESNQVSAVYDYSAARVRLDKATGRYAYVNNGAGYTAPPQGSTVGKISKKGQGDKR